MHRFPLPMSATAGRRLPLLLVFSFLVPLSAQDEQPSGTEVRSETQAVGVAPGDDDKTSDTRNNLLENIAKDYDRLNASPAGQGETQKSPDLQDRQSGGYFGPLLGLAVVVALILCSGWAVKRFLGGSVAVPRGRIRVIASCPLSQRSRLYIIEVEGQRFLIGEGNGQVSLIGRLDTTAEPQNIDTGHTGEETTPEDQAGLNPTFADRLREWERSVSGQSVSGEVRTSLRLMETLARRLRRGRDLPEDR